MFLGYVALPWAGVACASTTDRAAADLSDAGGSSVEAASSGEGAGSADGPADGGPSLAADSGVSAADGSLAADVGGDDGDADSGQAPIDGTVTGPSGPCAAVVQGYATRGVIHDAVCSHETYGTNPPCWGNHYPIWAAYRTYVTAIPEGFWVHNAEHGGVILTYNCPGGCPADVSAAQAWIDGLPNDPICNPTAGDARVRVVMTPDPNLDVRFAASAWGWTLRASCFDPAAFGAFFQAHYGQGTEVLCAQGQDLTLGVQDGCGE